MLTKCAKCNEGTLRRGSRAQTYPVGEQTFSVQIDVLECPKCGHYYVETGALQSLQRSVGKHLAEHGPATGVTFRYMRKSIGMAAKDVAELLATTPETVSRWETAERNVDLWAWLTMGSIVLDTLAGNTVTRDRLQALKSRKLAKTVPIELIATKRTKRR